MNRQPSETLDVLVTVKAYPTPSFALGESVCTASVTRDRRFVRLYPVPFRGLDEPDQFKKWQWITVRVHRRRSDHRPESFVPELETLRLRKFVSSDDNWRKRLALVEGMSAPSLCAIQKAQKERRTSLGLFRPMEVLDLTYEPTARAWSEEERQKLAQARLFGGASTAPLEKIPYKFHYVFRCEDCRAAQPHRCSIVDWELGQLYRRLAREGDEAGALRKIRERWLDDICAPTNDVLFFVGNQLRHPAAFMVLGCMRPKRDLQASLF